MIGEDLTANEIREEIAREDYDYEMEERYRLSDHGDN